MRFLLLAALVPLAACSVHSEAEGNGVAGTGSPTSRNYAIADFSGVDLRGSDDVDVRVGSAFTVRAEGPAKQLDQLVIEKVGDSLRIGRKKSGFSWSGGDHGEVKIFVTMPRIATANIAGSGNMAVDTVQGGKFEAASAGSGDLKIGQITVDLADFSLAGSGGIDAAGGTAKQLTVSIAGSGDVDAKQLKASAADVTVAGSGSVSADVAGPAKISMIGSGDVDVGKGAKCTISKVGSGEVTCG